MHIDPGDFTQEALSKIAPPCGECGETTGMAQVEFIYPNRPDLWQREDGSRPWFWYCSSCHAYCGAHRDTLKPFGTPGNAETRRARQDAHNAFDRLWRAKARKEGVSTQKARGAGYKWLAEQMGIPAKECHIGAMSALDAHRVMEICRPFLRRRT